MKQHLSIDQLQELTPAQREALREWWKPFWGDKVLRFGKTGIIAGYGGGEGFSFLGDGFSSASKDECLPLLSIGQCIAYLLEKQPAILVYRMPDENDFVVQYMDKEVPFLECGIDFTGDGFASDSERPELIDTLWEAVKAVLSCNQPNEQTKQVSG